MIHIKSIYLSESKHVIEEAKRTETPRYGLTVLGYSINSGAPTSILVRLKGEKRWRRVMIWQFSNAGTCFIRIKNRPYIVSNSDLFSKIKQEVLS